MQVLKDEIREKILRDAEKHFFNCGFRDTTMRGIAKEVGISVSNLYLYYKNKEDLFSAVVGSFYLHFIEGFTSFTHHTAEPDNVEVSISQIFQSIIKADQKKFVIITDKSHGTKYQDFKEEIVDILFGHMKNQVKAKHNADDLILLILAKNFFNGIIEIAKNYHDDKWLKESMDILVKYHMGGMVQLM